LVGDVIFTFATDGDDGIDADDGEVGDDCCAYT
jgi:hypothetical protein